MGPSTTELSALGLHRPPLADVLARHLFAWTAADADGHAGQYFRVEGTLLTGPVSGPVYWATKGTGRGGNNYAGGGALIDEITEDENEYYRLEAGDFPEPWAIASC